MAPSGKLLDAQGFAVAGLVHENEYVIPEWMRADPKVAQMEQWLETRRLRGYAQGRATTDGGAPLPSDEVAGTGSGDMAQLLQNEKIDTWARELQVVQSLHDLDRDYTTFKRVNNAGVKG